MPAAPAVPAVPAAPAVPAVPPAPTDHSGQPLPITPTSTQVEPGSTPGEPAPPADVPLAQGLPLPALVPVTDEEDGRRSYQIPVPSSGGPAQPLTLEEAYRLGSKHPAIKAAQQEIARADLLDNQMLVGWHPQLTATGSYIHFDEEVKMGMPDFGSIHPDPRSPIGVGFATKEIILQPQDMFSAQVDLMAPLFVGPLLPALKAARETQQLSRLSFARAQLSFLLTPIATTYYGAVAAGEAVVVANRSLEVTRKHYEATTRMFEVGQATRLAVLQAEIAVIQAEQKLRQAHTGWTAALRGLEILLGVQGPLQLQHPRLPPAPGGDETTLLAQALQQREDYLAAQRMIRAAELGRSKADWGWSPSLAAIGSYSISNRENFAGESDAWQIGLALKLPVWDGGARLVEREMANVQVIQAIQQRRAIESAIANEINMQLKAVQEAEADLVQVRHMVALAREGVAAAQASFEVGMATNLEVLDANQKLFEAEIGLVQTQIKLDLTRLQLAHAVGMFRPLAEETAAKK
ncbi:MAG: TolC family protein [Deltaproteobacteria bacterium]|nr:TolC family protein [Deltaproteobacteria bacterium]